MATYESYKDSGVKWLGQIPSHWEVKKLRAFFDRRNTKVSDIEYRPLSVTKNGIVPQMENVAKSKDSDNRRLVKIGDFVINSRSDRKGSSGVSSLEGSVSFVNTIMTPRQNVVPTYCNYLLKSIAFIEENYRNGHGIVADLWTTSFDEQKLIKLAMPPRQEQEAIVAYLDKVTGEIDRAIEAQQKMIDALNQRKQIIITRAVTRGLNSDVPLRDSGIDWLGQIPEHWDRIYLKYLGDVRNGLTYRPGDLVDNGRLVIRSSNIKDNRLSFKDNVYVEDFPNKLNVKSGDIIICSRNGSASLVGKSIYIENDIDATFGAFMLRFRPIKASKFWHYALLSCIAAYKSLFSTSTINQLTVSTFKHMMIALPPESEQVEIVEHLNVESHKLDNAILSCERMISLLQERKQIIINEVVTGKKKVI